jgi:hypothetical protein
MFQPIDLAECRCPVCSGVIRPSTNGGATACPMCRWTGDVFLFKRFPVDARSAEAALPEDATCIQHPTKKATAICAGTGDYICALCAIDVNGQTYSAQYLSNKGKDTASKAFDRYLPRPDNTAYLLIVCSIIAPYVNAVLLATAGFWVPYAFYVYTKSLRMRRENDLFRRAMPTSRVFTIPIGLGIIGLCWIAMVIALLYFLLLEPIHGR